MFLSERMRRSPRAGLWRWIGMVGFVPLVLAATTRAEPIEDMLGPFLGTVYEVACAIVVVAGLALRAGLAGCHSLARDRLDASGFYSLTRNPVYFANSLVLIGIALSTQDIVLAIAVALWLAVYYERTILAEEARLFKRFGLAFVGWATLTPVFLPRLSGWRRPAARFNLRAMMRQEPVVWFAAIAALGGIGLLSDHFGSGGYDDPWILVLLAMVTVSAGLSLLASQSGLLDDPEA